jgi:hypothetical protein
MSNGWPGPFRLALILVVHIPVQIVKGWVRIVRDASGLDWSGSRKKRDKEGR